MQHIYCTVRIKCKTEKEDEVRLGREMKDKKAEGDRKKERDPDKVQL